MIHAKQWHYSLYRDFQQLHSIHSTRRSPRDSSSTNSTFRRQRALRVILHAEGKEIFYPVYKDLQGIPDIPVIHDTPAFQALLHVPAPSSTIQYLPVLSSVSRDSTHSSISSIRMQILHTDWFALETPLSTSRIHYYKLSFFKEREMLRYRSNVDIFYRIELRVKLTFSQSRINSSLRLVKVKS